MLEQRCLYLMVLSILGGSSDLSVLATRPVEGGGGIELLNVYRNMLKDRDYFTFLVSQAIFICLPWHDVRLHNCTSSLESVPKTSNNNNNYFYYYYYYYYYYSK